MTYTHQFIVSQWELSIYLGHVFVAGQWNEEMEESHVNGEQLLVAGWGAIYESRPINGRHHSTKQDRALWLPAMEQLKETS